MKLYNTFLNELFSKKKKEPLKIPDGEKLPLFKVISKSLDLVKELDVYFYKRSYNNNTELKGKVISGDQFTVNIMSDGKRYVLPTGMAHFYIPTDIKIKKRLKKIIKFLFVFDIKPNYFDFGSSNDKISYLIPNRIKTVLDKGLDPWDNNYRNEVKIGRFVRNIVGDKMNTADIEKFVNHYKAMYDVYNDKSDLQIVDGEDIRYWYLGDNYSESRKGTLPNSCMRYKYVQKRLKLFSKNPKVCKLLIKVDGGKLLARALIWKTNKGTYLDRVYYINDNDKNLFELYAKKKGWMTYSSDINMTVKLKWCVDSEDEEDFPYMDTFAYLDIDARELTNDDYSDYDVELDYAD